MHLKENFIINIFAFAIFMFAQQIVIMPNILKISGENIFANVILLFTLVNVFLYITVYSLGNTFLIDINLYKKENNSKGNFNLMLLIIVVVIIVCGIIGELFIEPKYYSIIIAATTVLSVFRVWCEFQYRYENNYKRILLQNIFYLFGALVIFLDLAKAFSKIPYIFFLISEIAVLIIYVDKILLNLKEIQINKNLRNTFITFFNVSAQTGMINLITYFDRFFLYPMFGVITLNFYYAVTIASKAIYLFITPVNSVLTGYLANVDESNKICIFYYLKKISKKYFIILSIASFVISFIILKLLYPQYFNIGKTLLPIISVSTALDCLIGIYLIVCRRFLNAKKLTAINLIKVFMFCLCTGLLGYFFGINGVISGILLSNMFCFGIYFCMVKKYFEY